MASGSSYKKATSQEPDQLHSLIPAGIPQRATRQLTRQLPEGEVDERAGVSSPRRATRALKTSYDGEVVTTLHTNQIFVDEFQPSPLMRHAPWLKPLIICMVIGLVFITVLVSAGLGQRPNGAQVVSFAGGQSYSIQVGGKLVGSWQKPVAVAPKASIKPSTGPYAVRGKPSLTVDFINSVLAAYNSPAAGKGQALYNLGVKYDIDPAFALAFFMHESSFGTAGEARTTLSLGNLRCINSRPCIDQDRGGYAQMKSWEDGFEIWYQLISNYYIAQLGESTVDQIIPTYAPTADNNDEIAYINSLKHELDTWHSGQIMVS